MPPKALPPRKYQSNSSSTFVALAAVTDAAIFGVMGPRNHRPAAVRYSYSIK